MIKGVVRLVLGGNMKLKRLAALALTGVIGFTTLFGCGANAEDTIATLGEEKVSFGVANFLTKYQKSTVDDVYTMYASMYGVDSMWDIDASGSGSTTEEEFKTSAMELLHDMYTLKAHMADYGVEITAEDEAAIKEAANAFLAANSAEAIEEFGATEEIVTELLNLYTIQAKMFQAIIVDTDRVVSDEDANMRGYSMIQIDLSGHYNDEDQWVKYTEEELADIKSAALKMDLDLNVKSMEDVAKEHGHTVTTNAYHKEDLSMDTTLLGALNGLKEGEVSDMIETDTALYFVRIDADVDEKATEEKRDSIIAERENKLYQDVLTKWQENDGWDVNESLVDEIEFHNVFTIYEETEEASENVDSTESN